MLTCKIPRKDGTCTWCKSTLDCPYAKQQITTVRIKVFDGGAVNAAEFANLLTDAISKIPKKINPENVLVNFWSKGDGEQDVVELTWDRLETNEEIQERLDTIAYQANTQDSYSRLQEEHERKLLAELKSKYEK